MNQDPNNPTAPNPAMPQTPAMPSNPAAAAAPMVNSAPTPAPAPAAPAAPATPAAPEAPATPETPAAPEAPALDDALIRQAIADVPEEATASTADSSSPAVSLDNLDAASTATSDGTTSSDASMFTTAMPSAGFETTTQDTQAAATNPADPNAVPTDAEQQKNPPSVAFNDPAQQPDADNKKHGKDINFSEIFEKIKKRPMLSIIVGGTIVIVALVLILAFAI